MQTKVQRCTDQRSINETEFVCEETAETESTADTTCRGGERIHFGTLFSRFRVEEHQQRNTKQVVGNSKSLARRAVDAMGRECKHGVKFIGLSEATKYRFGRPVQVLVDEDVRLTPTFEICLNQWQQIGCDVWYFADDSSSSDTHGTKLHIRGLVFRKKEKDDDDDVVYSSAK